MKNNKKTFPPAQSWRRLVGPSFLILALGLGSGEVILWPYLVSNYGLGIAWGALLGITFQYFINMEIERYALVKGESVFVGLKKFYSWAPGWFIVSSFLGFGLPGIAASSAKVLAAVFGLADFKLLAIALLLAIGLILSLSRTVYSMMEKLTQAVILVGVPFILLLVLYLIRWEHVAALASGLVGQGQGFAWLPGGISLATFLGAFVYSGAGGNLNLTQSIYVKEKGYGMGKYAEKMSGLFRHPNGSKAIKVSGESCEINDKSLANFKNWWRQVSIEHAIVFWGVGLFTIVLLMLLSYATAYGLAGNEKGIQFVLNEAVIIGNNILPWAGSAFLLVIGVMLFQTQLGVFDSTSRIMAENLAVMNMDAQGEVKADLPRIYFSFLWMQIAFGCILFMLNYYEPKSLLVLGGVINAVAMFVHVGLVAKLNHRSLPKEFRPRPWRRYLIAVIFVFLGIFSAITIQNEGKNLFDQITSVAVPE